MINDMVFGNLNFDFIWTKYTQIDFFSQKPEIAIMISGEENGTFEKGQYEAYQKLMDNWGEIHISFLKPILMYYQNRREELGYEIESNKNYPQIKSPEEILNHITLVGINVPYAELYGGRSIGITFDCTWDEENGLGLRLSDEQIVKIGFQDVAI